MEQAPVSCTGFGVGREFDHNPCGGYHSIFRGCIIFIVVHVIIITKGGALLA